MSRINYSNLNFPNNFTCLWGKLARESTSLIAKSTAPWPGYWTYFSLHNTEFPKMVSEKKNYLGNLNMDKCHKG